jgi:hypothetical protein
MTDTIFGQVSSRGSRPLLNIAQRTPDDTEIEERNQSNLSRKIRVAMPCQVVSFDPVKQTISAQPLIREKIVNREDGGISWLDLPLLTDIPVIFPGAGNLVLTMPVKAGDEVEVLFQDMCMDAWFSSGGIQNWMDRRRHDLSDGVCILGLNSQPNVIENFSTDAAELRTRDNTVSVSVKQTDSGVSSLTLTADDATVTMQKQTLVSEGIPHAWGNIKLAVDSANVEIGYTNTTVIIMGVPVQVPTPTVSLVGKVMVNGVSI